MDGLWHWVYHRGFSEQRVWRWRAPFCARDTWSTLNFTIKRITLGTVWQKGIGKAVVWCFLGSAHINTTQRGLSRKRVTSIYFNCIFFMTSCPTKYLEAGDSGDQQRPPASVTGLLCSACSAQGKTYCPSLANCYEAWSCWSQCCHLQESHALSLFSHLNHPFRSIRTPKF